MPNDREIFLQNLVATSATLVFRCAKALSSSSPSEREALVIECETWFLDTRRALAEEARKPEPAHNPQPSPVWRHRGEDQEDREVLILPKALDYFR